MDGSPMHDTIPKGVPKTSQRNSTSTESSHIKIVSIPSRIWDCVVFERENGAKSNPKLSCQILVSRPTAPNSARVGKISFHSSLDGEFL